MTIDPRLLNEGMFENSVNQGELDSLENMLFLPTGSSQTAQLEDFATQGHLKDMHNDLSATDFVGLYSTINISTNTNFAMTWNKLKEQNKDDDGSPCLWGTRGIYRCRLFTIARRLKAAPLRR